MEKKKPASERVAAKVRDYQQVFSSKAGERVLQDLVAGSHFLDAPFPKDVFEAGFAAGQRSVVQGVLAKLATDSSKLLELMRAMEERRQNER